MPPASHLSSHPLPRSGLILTELTATSPQVDVETARELLLSYGHFVATQSGVTSFCYGALEQEAASVPESYLNQQGGCMIATIHEIPAGFVAWRTLPRPELSDAWELKRLWASPESRGSGIGRALLQAVIDLAVAAAKSRILLDSAPDTMGSAIRLYREFGFIECEPYNGRSPDGIIYMQKTLGTEQ
jgi:ribosomal protein S18 acetylase RimI-like enzyme